MIMALYAIAQVIELSIGVYICNKIYNEWRLKTWWWKILCLISGGIWGIAYIYNAYLALVSNLMLLFSGIVVAIIFCVFFRTNFWTIFLLQVVYNINVSFLKMPIMIVRCIYEGKNLLQINRGDKTLIECIGCIVINVLLIIFIVRSEKIIKIIKLLFLKKKLCMGGLVIVQWILLTYTMWLGEQGYETADLIINALIIVCTVLAIQCFVYYIVYQEDMVDNKMLYMTQGLLEGHYNKMQQVYCQNSKKMHDVKHHMLYLLNCIKQEEYHQAEEHIVEYIEGDVDSENKVWSGFSFLDFIINVKKGDMEDKGIDFRLDIELYEYPFEDIELGVLLGNLLDNAIDAAEACNEGERCIYLCLRTVNEMFMLILKNSSNSVPKMKDNRFLTRKDDEYAHGWGIESVMHIVEKYEGNIGFEYCENQFEVRILV